MRKKLVFKTCLLLLLTLASAFAEEGFIKTQGKSPLTESNQTLAREKAISNFKHQVVAKALVSLLGPDKFKEHKEVLTKPIILKPERYIKSFRILSEETKEDLYIVEGEAVVSYDALRQSLSELGISIAEKPKLTSEKTQPIRILLLFDHFCDEKVGEKEGGELFEEILREKLSEGGISPEEETQDNTDKPKVKISFYCFSNRIKANVEIAKNSEVEISEEMVPREEEVPLMDSITQLASLVTLGLEEALPTASEAPKREGEQPSKESAHKTESKPEPEQWTITIKGKNAMVYWEGIYKKLVGKGYKIDISRIVASPESYSVETQEVSEDMVEVIKNLSFEEGETIKVEEFNKEKKQLILNIAKPKEN